MDRLLGDLGFRTEGGDREELLHRQFRGHRESLHVDLAVREFFLPQLHLLQMGQEEEGHEHGHLVPDAARRQLAQRNRLAVELREPVPGEGDVLREVLPVHLRMACSRNAFSWSWISDSRRASSKASISSISVTARRPSRRIASVSGVAVPARTIWL